MVYVALLRGINVGGKNKINMKDLVLSFMNQGMKSVKTYINSGNIIFENSGLSHIEIKEKLEKAILDDFSLQIPVLLLNFDQYRELYEAIPEDWQNDKEFKSDVLFLWDDVDITTILETLKPKEFETLILIPGALLWYIDRKYQSKSALIKLPSKPLYKQVTIRNVNTTRKIWHLMQEVCG